jgi:hypothetical protein
MTLQHSSTCIQNYTLIAQNIAKLYIIVKMIVHYMIQMLQQHRVQPKCGSIVDCFVSMRFHSLLSDCLTILDREEHTCNWTELT